MKINDDAARHGRRRVGAANADYRGMSRIDIFLVVCGIRKTAPGRARGLARARSWLRILAAKQAGEAARAPGNFQRSL
jgi:hypothetical protein